MWLYLLPSKRNLRRSRDLLTVSDGTHGLRQDVLRQKPAVPARSLFEKAPEVQVWPRTGSVAACGSLAVTTAAG